MFSNRPLRFSLAFSALAATLMACSGSPEKKILPQGPQTSSGEIGVEKPSDSNPSERLDLMTEGLYRLDSVQAQQDFVMTDPDPNSRATSKIHFAVRTDFEVLASTRKFDVRPTPLRQSLKSEPLGAAVQANKVLSPQLKLPLTLRIQSRNVSFEQIRLFWFCVKTSGFCPQNLYLSSGKSDRTDVIQPALDLANHNLVPTDPDPTTGILSIRTWATTKNIVIAFETAAPDELSPPMRWRLVYRPDRYPLEEDQVGNPGEENLRGPDPRPTP